MSVTYMELNTANAAILIQKLNQVLYQTSNTMSTESKILAHAAEIYTDKVKKGLPLTAQDRRVLQMAVDITPKRTMYFKDEGGYYITKLTADGQPIEANKMYEYGTLTHVPVANKKEAKQYAKEHGCIATFG